MKWIAAGLALSDDEAALLPLVAGGVPTGDVGAPLVGLFTR